jgi:nucleotide-binding universal stress UspA family protein
LSRLETTDCSPAEAGEEIEMSLKNILVHVDDSAQCKQRLDVACDLARQHGAHLSAIYVVPFPFIPAGMAAGYVPESFIAEQEEFEREQAKKAKDLFDKHMATAGIAAEWRQGEGSFAGVVSMNARYADLAILSQFDSSSGGGYERLELPADVALSAGRPVLVVPYIGAGRSIGTNILVGWNASREATRAVNDALPLLERANKVTILAVDPERGIDGQGEVPGADIALHLARHGVKAEASQTATGDIDIGDVLLSRAADLGADLIVIGAYGHSRMREFVMGGVTRHLLQHMTVPVLMSH